MPRRGSGLAEPRTTAILSGHVGAINAIAFTADGTHLVTGGVDGTLRLWDITAPGPSRDCRAIRRSTLRTR